MRYSIILLLLLLLSTWCNHHNEIGNIQLSLAIFHFIFHNISFTFNNLKNRIVSFVKYHTTIVNCIEHTDTTLIQGRSVDLYIILSVLMGIMLVEYKQEDTKQHEVCDIL